MAEWIAIADQAPERGTIVEVELRSGDEMRGLADSFRWSDTGEDEDIMYWRYYDVSPVFSDQEEYDPVTRPETFTRLPTDPAARKAVPIYSGVLMYFPDAIAAVAECSQKGNDQHNPGQPLHWDRSKSGDHLDALTRHLMEADEIDTDGVRHATKIAWRALAFLQVVLEREAKS